MLRRIRKNLRSSSHSNEVTEDHLSDVVEGVIEVRLEGEEEDHTGKKSWTIHRKTQLLWDGKPSRIVMPLPPQAKTVTSLPRN